MSEFPDASGGDADPRINSFFHVFINDSLSQCCFMLAKVQDVYGMEPASPKCSERMSVLLLDLSGCARQAKIWLPACHQTGERGISNNKIYSERFMAIDTGHLICQSVIERMS